VSEAERAAALRLAGDAPAVTLLDRTKVRTIVDSRGWPSLEIEHFERYLVLRDGAAEVLRPTASYDDNLALTSFTVWTVTPTGETLKPDPRETWDVRSFPGDLLYTEGRRRITLPRGIVPGAVVNVRSVFHQAHARFIPPIAVFGEFPILRLEVIAAAAPRTVLSLSLLPDGDVVPLEPDGTSRIVRQDIPVFRGAPGAPPILRYQPFVGASVTEAPGGAGAAYFHDWPELANYYLDLVKANLTPDAALRTIAKSLAETAGEDRGARIRAAAQWVRTHLRYVAVEVGIHAVKPRPVADILRRGYGDCKEFTALLVVLLRLLDVKASPFLLSSDGVASLPRALPGMQWFNHAIVAVPEASGYRFIDPTFAAGDTWSLGASEQGVEGLVISRTPTIERTPVDTMVSNRHRTRIHADLEVDGSATIDLEETLSGLPAIGLREHLRFGTPGGGHRFRSAALRSRYGVGETEILSASGLDGAAVPTGSPTVVALHLLAHGFAVRLGARWLLYPELLASSSDLGLPSAGAASAPLDLGPPRAADVETTFALPAGAAIDLLPDPVVVDRPFGHLEVRFQRPNDREIRYTRHLQIRGGVAASADRAAVAAFRDAIAAATSAPALIALPAVAPNGAP
jgi:hypothetical protein